MQKAEPNRSLWIAAYTVLDLIYHNTVRSIRKGHRDAVFAILVSIIQNIIMIAVFFAFFDIMGLRGLAIRGDFLLYVMSGIFVFMTHIKAVGAVAGSDGPTSSIMMHLPMTTTIAIWSAAFSALYIQTVSMASILLAYHLLWTPIEIADPVGASLMLLLAWFSGCAIGSVFLACKPWLPYPTSVVQMVYQRINMFASGKMFVANQLSAQMVALFAWNPLFHIIDQGRGYVFVNYNPMKSNIEYPLIMTAIFLTIGLVGESLTRKHMSVSWTAGK